MIRGALDIRPKERHFICIYVLLSKVPRVALNYQQISQDYTDSIRSKKQFNLFNLVDKKIRVDSRDPWSFRHKAKRTAFYLYLCSSVKKLLSPISIVTNFPQSPFAPKKSRFAFALKMYYLCIAGKEVISYAV